MSLIRLEITVPFYKIISNTLSPTIYNTLKFNGRLILSHYAYSDNKVNSSILSAHCCLLT